MRTIIVAKVDKIQQQKQTNHIHFFESVENLTESESICVLDETQFVSADLKDEADNIIIPAASFTNRKVNNMSIYFELEVQPFFQKIKDIMLNRQGVLRFRRNIPSLEQERLIVSDLFVFSSLLGEPYDVKVKRTQKASAISHIIVTVNFGSGTMAHLEYTFLRAVEETIEFEWSGVRQIIEFNSSEMEPIEYNRDKSLALSYSVDLIKSTSIKADQMLIDKMNRYLEIIQGG